MDYGHTIINDNEIIIRYINYDHDMRLCLLKENKCLEKMLKSSFRGNL